jgi:hypothetical protein
MFAFAYCGRLLRREQVMVVGRECLKEGLYLKTDMCEDGFVKRRVLEVHISVAVYVQSSS